MGNVMDSIMRSCPRGLNRALNKPQSVKGFDVGMSASAVGARERGGAMPGANNAFVEFSGVQKTYDGDTLVVKDTWILPAVSF